MALPAVPPTLLGYAQPIPTPGQCRKVRDDNPHLRHALPVPHGRHPGQSGPVHHLCAVEQHLRHHWDLFMDFSLLQAHSRHFLLRDILALKRRWPYYGAMVVDPALRFVWVFYAIFTHNTQHSTMVSFPVSQRGHPARPVGAFLSRKRTLRQRGAVQGVARRASALPHRAADETAQRGAQPRASDRGATAMAAAAAAGSTAAHDPATAAADTARPTAVGNRKRRHLNGRCQHYGLPEAPR